MITYRPYNPLEDFNRVEDFLVQHFQPGDRDGNWLQPAWEYMVATDPDFRRRGLGKAAALEGIRRGAACGATTAYVGSDGPLYQALGFKRVYTSECWTKSFPSAVPEG